jgi:CheY-like chemotaxis protein
MGRGSRLCDNRLRSLIPNLLIFARPMPPDSEHTTADGLLVSRDLFFASKITGTAAELGFRVAVEGNVAAASSKAVEPTCRCVILDLTLPNLNVAELLAALPQATRPAVIAFGPHVQTARLEEARAAGCDDVFPRSKFSASLTSILMRYLSEKKST